MLETLSLFLTLYSLGEMLRALSSTHDEREAKRAKRAEREAERQRVEASTRAERAERWQRRGLAFAAWLRR